MLLRSGTRADDVTNNINNNSNDNNNNNDSNNNNSNDSNSNNNSNDNTNNNDNNSNSNTGPPSTVVVNKWFDLYDRKKHDHNDNNNNTSGEFGKKCGSIRLKLTYTFKYVPWG